MTNPDFRALCAELLSALENEGYAHWTVIPDEDELCLRARAALAQPELEVVGPSESDVTELFYRHVGEGSEVGFEAAIEEALARWGHPSPQPIPVSERLPEAGDCDANGRCWYSIPSKAGAWELIAARDLQGVANAFFTHGLSVKWLPAHALPLPHHKYN